MCFPASLPGSALGRKVARLPLTGCTVVDYFTEVCLTLFQSSEAMRGAVINITTLFSHVSEMF